MGIALSARNAAIGLRLWPSETESYELAATNSDGESAYGIIMPGPNGRAEYLFSQMFESPSSDFWCSTRLHTPFTLGCLHANLTKDFSSLAPRKMSAEDAAEANTSITEFVRAA